MKKPIERAISAAGGLSALADALGMKPQVVHNWRSRGVPAKQAIAVEQASKGIVTRHDLRPDLYPKEAA